MECSLIHLKMGQRIKTDELASNCDGETKFTKTTAGKAQIVFNIHIFEISYVSNI